MISYSTKNVLGGWTKINIKNLLGERSFLNIHENIEINTEENSIIFGSNGIGKTTIYRKLKESYSNFDYLDYEDTKNAFLKNKKNITLNTSLYIEPLSRFIQSQ